MENKWNMLLERYVCNTTSPDGRDTFESTASLANEIMRIANIGANDFVVDIGCGCGNVTRLCTTYTEQTVIGIEPNFQTIKKAKQLSPNYNIKYIQGSFERPQFNEKADIIISSLAFHQVKYGYKSYALKMIQKILKKSGRFILCDVMIMFDVRKELSKFNRVYRYLLEKTTPADIYQKQIAPYMDETHHYTWNDMKEYTPKDFWFYSLGDMEKWLKENNLKITKQLSLCPFFGILTIEHISKNE